MNDLLLRRRELLNTDTDDFVILNKTQHPKLMSIMYNNGLCASPNKMYKSEAEAVPDGTFGNGRLGNETRPVSPFDFGKLAYANRPLNEDFSAFKYFKNITSIGYYSFYYAGLSKIILPPNCISFGYRCLMSNNFKFIKVPEAYTGTTGPNTQVFYYATGSGNRNIYFPHTTPPRLLNGWWLFIGTLTPMQGIWVPDDSVTAYKTAWANCSTTSTGTSNVLDWLNLIKPVSECPFNISDYE